MKIQTTLPSLRFSHVVLLGLTGLFSLSAGAAAPEPGHPFAVPPRASSSAESAPDPAPSPAETDAAPAVPELSDEERAAAVAAATTYRARLGELVTAPGAYSPEISEAYAGLGSTLQTLGDHEEALSALDSALQSLRITSGLTDARQMPVLDEMIESNLALEDWDQVDALTHLNYHIAMRNYPPGAPPRFEALLRLARWKFRATVEELLGGNRAPEDESIALYNKEIDAIATLEPYADRNIQLGLLHLELAAVEFQQAKHNYELPLMAFQTTQQRSVSRIQCTSIRLPNGTVIQECTSVEEANPDYFALPQIMKGQEVSTHLGRMRDSVMDAYNVLQSENMQTEDRDMLLAEVQRMTNMYNEFVLNARVTTGTNIRRTSN